jgi:hypothetical protein
MNESPRYLFYFPNPAHKTVTTEAGPPRWYPKKTACEEELTTREAQCLLEQSVAEDGEPLNPRRWAVRRVGNEVRWYRTLPTQVHPDGKVEVHGHPFVPGYPKVPPRVLRQMRERGMITAAEYKELVRA